MTGESTRAVHGPVPRPVTQQPVAPPLYRTTTFQFDSGGHTADVFAGRVDGWSYSRTDNPTAAAFADAVAALEDPVGEELDHRSLASGLDLRKLRVPLGVVAVVYEARPNVTIDCAALTVKSGNAIVLRGSHYAERSNGALAAVAREALFMRPALRAHPVSPATALGCELLPDGLVRADADGRTSVTGVWAAGNVADLSAQVGASAAAGAMAGAQINADLVMEEARSTPAPA